MAEKKPKNKMNVFLTNQQVWEEEYVSKIEHANKTRLYEGRQYHSRGIYRSAINCIMFTRTTTFCPACQRAINMVIDSQTR